jgi:hypothetical protein
MEKITKMRAAMVSPQREVYRTDFRSHHPLLMQPKQVSDAVQTLRPRGTQHKQCRLLVTSTLANAACNLTSASETMWEQHMEKYLVN